MKFKLALLLTLAALPALAQEPVKPTVPWPAPEAWSRHKLSNEEKEKLATAKKIFIQSAIPPEYSVPPKGITQHYTVTDNLKDADLILFLKRKQIDSPKANWADAARFGGPPSIEHVQEWRYQAIIQDMAGNTLADGWWGDTGGLWRILQTQIERAVKRKK